MATVIETQTKAELAAKKLLTAQEFRELAPEETPEFCELEKGKVIQLPPPTFLHGHLCNEFAWWLTNYVKANESGHVGTNDSAVVTARDPDTVRGADVSYYSFTKIPRGVIPTGYFEFVPDLVAEVLSPSDRWPAVLSKVAEYLAAEVQVVLVIDPEPESKTIRVFRIDGTIDVLHDGDTLTLPTLMPGFELPLAKLFG